MGGSNSATTAKPIAGYNQAAFTGLGMGNGLINAATQMSPELRTADIDYLQQTAAREALINALKSADLEKMVSPDISRTRGELNKQIADDLSGAPSVPLSNMWMKQGLTDLISAGVNTNGTFARSALADKTRADYAQERAANQGKASALLAANPQPTAGIDPGSIAGIITQTKADNANARDAWNSNVLNLMGNQANNTYGAFQQAMQMEAARRSGDASAMNAMKGQQMASNGAMTGASIGAGGAIIGAGIIF